METSERLGKRSRNVYYWGPTNAQVCVSFCSCSIHGHSMPRSLEVSKRAHLRTLAKAMLSCAKHAIEVKVGGSPRKRHRRLLARLKVGGLLASLNGHTGVEYVRRAWTPILYLEREPLVPTASPTKSEGLDKYTAPHPPLFASSQLSPSLSRSRLKSSFDQ